MSTDIAGRRVSQSESIAARTYLDLWAKSQDGAYAYSYALKCWSTDQRRGHLIFS